VINPEMIESLREPGFARRAWGYDRYQVDSFLEELIERLERLQAESRALPEGAELSGVGRRVEEILTGARGAAAEVATAADQRAEGLRRESEEAAEKLRRESEEAASELKRGSEEAAEQQRREADEYARNTRSAADEYASSTRAEAEAEVAKLRELAEADAETKRAAAEEEAERILRNARLELGRVEESIEKLRERRALVIQSIEQMRGNLSSMVGEASRGTGEFVGVSTGNGSVENPEEEGTAVLDTEQPTEEGEWAAKTEEESAADAEEEFEGDYEDETLEQRRRVVFDDETDEQAIRTEDL
jgi:hypothetical protein